MTFAGEIGRLLIIASLAAILFTVLFGAASAGIGIIILGGGMFAILIGAICLVIDRLERRAQ